MKKGAISYRRNIEHFVLLARRQYKRWRKHKTSSRNKCPVPRKTFTTDVHDQIPKYYVPQLLSQMTVLKVDELLFLSYTMDSSTVFRVKHDENLWKDIWKKIINLYGCEQPLKPNKLSQSVPELKKKIDLFLTNNVEFLAEVPSVKVIPCAHSEPNSLEEQRHFHDSERRPATNRTELSHALRIANKAQTELVITAEKLTRPTASEILVFMLSDLDRTFDPEKTHSIPIAYGLKGYSLRSDVMRSMISFVRSECQKVGLSVPVVSFDGQWSRVGVRD